MGTGQIILRTRAQRRIIVCESVILSTKLREGQICSKHEAKKRALRSVPYVNESCIIISLAVELDIATKKMITVRPSFQRKSYRLIISARSKEEAI